MKYKQLNDSVLKHHTVILDHIKMRAYWKYKVLEF